jgi:hypoxanthine phosphoribosyltransferase
VDLALNVANFTPDEQVSIVENTLRLRNMIPGEPLGSAAEAQMLFRIHMKLAEFGLALPTRVEAGRMPFSHPTEQIFADLLDFYRIPWQYEPRSFPLQWDKDGNVTEAFTPDFYLPEFDLYVELTTMKQSLVTRKNHKIKLLKAIYPHINIQVFYQKDMLDLTLKYGLSRSESES